MLIVSEIRQPILMMSAVPCLFHLALLFCFRIVIVLLYQNRCDLFVTPVSGVCHLRLLRSKYNFSSHKKM